ncbi:MAG: SdrD B-like domain-containing protein [Kiritimatiellia bacterium]
MKFSSLIGTIFVTAGIALGSAHAQLVVSNSCFALADGGAVGGAADGSAEDIALTINKLTGVVAPLGATGATGTFNGEALAFWPNSSTLFTFDAGVLVKLNLSTGAKTIIGSPGTIQGPLGAIAVDDIDGLTFDASVSPPRMYASLRRAANGANDLLMLINTNNGSVVANAFGTGKDYLVVSNYTASGGQLCDDVDDIALDPATDVMYAILNDGGASDQLVTIDLTSGAINRLGELTVDDAEGLAFYIDGSLFASTGKDAANTATRNRLFDIDKTNGTATNPRVLTGYEDIEGLTCFTANASLIGDFVWRDTNRNGIQDSGEPGVAGVTVRIYRSSDNTLLGTKTTDAQGRYSFVEPTGSYYVVFTAPSGYAFTSQDAGGNDAVDSDANTSTGRSHTFSVPLNGNDLTIDAGLICLNPVIVCPPTVVLECPATGTGTNVTGRATATSPCGCAVTVAFADTSAPGCGATYTLTRTWTATDACGGSATCAQTIQIQDTTKPVLVGVPANTTVQCDAIPAAPTVTATDTCDNSVIPVLTTSTTPGACAQSYTLTRTWTATDDCGNVQTAAQVITVQDTTAPVISGVGGPATIQCDQPIVFSSPTATDNCDATPTLTFADATVPGSCPQNFVRTRTWTATDKCGNSRTASQAITVQDTTAPVISGVGGPATIQCDQPIVFSSPTATDNCDATPTLTFADATVPGSCPQNFVRTHHRTATDRAATRNRQPEVITVQDTTAPVISGVGGPATIQCDQPIVFSSPTATDNCDATPTLTFADATVPGSCPQNVRTRTWTATDGAGRQDRQPGHPGARTTAPVISGVGGPATIQMRSAIVFSSPTATGQLRCDADPHLRRHPVVPGSPQGASCAPAPGPRPTSAATSRPPARRSRCRTPPPRSSSGIDPAATIDATSPSSTPAPRPRPTTATRPRP